MLITTLPTSPAPSYCLDSCLRPGTGIDAITGRVKAHRAIDFERRPFATASSQAPKNPSSAPEICVICSAKKLLTFWDQLCFLLEAMPNEYLISRNQTNPRC